MTKILRTPDERFADLPDFPFEPHYFDLIDPDLGIMRMHYVDEGPKDGPVVLLLHGEPSWSYLYRHMIPVLTAAGMRVLAPDLIGFGRSDKPAEREDYTYKRHVNWVFQWLQFTKTTDITLFAQDWGGLIGLRLVAEHPGLFARVMIGNTGLPTGNQDLGEAFRQWQEFARISPSFNIGNIVNGGVVRTLSPEEIAAYDAPFPGPEFEAGARQFPTLVPATPEDPAAEDQLTAWASLMEFNKPFLTCFSDSDQITKGGEVNFQKLIPGAQGQPHFITQKAGHFLQEDAGPLLAEKLVEFIRAE